LLGACFVDFFNTVAYFSKPERVGFPARLNKNIKPVCGNERSTDTTTFQEQ